MLKADDILAAEDLKIEPIDLPEWGGSAFIRVMNGTERDSWEVYAQKQMSSDRVNMRARLAVICLCDDKGERIFKDSQAADLAKKSSIALDRVYEAAVRLNRIGAADLEALEKN